MATEQENYVDQSISMAIQDAVDNIRNVTEISNTASGVALSKMLSGGDKATCLQVIEESTKLISNAVSNYERVIKLSIDGRRENYKVSEQKKKFFLF
ncbi:hypothetical protein [Vibrio owensii]|uniref:Uncharacterized protein n=1 Tax=Vibrio owensii CAIM 1854 = LMG 25443 TaxID=1229493 RepID=A0A0C1Z607_9VIBR|nr:hypothetical protein [Vibrio owensii]KIF51604.1 hypothetical protein H735_18830 [Vibrio owensii CAIM 1854 = LMG 25443]